MQESKPAPEVLMSGYRFSAVERYAVYTVHGPRCYLCSEPLDLQSMRVDHVIPRLLHDDPVRLAAVLKDYGLPSGFKLDSPENWLPACEICNVAKGKEPFRATPIIQRYIDRARSKAPQVQAALDRVLSDQAISKALNTVARALEQKQLDISVLEPLIKDYRQSTNADVIHEFRISPNQKVLYEGNGYQIVQATYGAGFVPSKNDVSFECPHCGKFGPWSGARCLSCGHLIEDD